MAVILRSLWLAMLVAACAAVWTTVSARAAMPGSMHATLLEMKDRARTIERAAMQLSTQARDPFMRSAAFAVAFEAHRLHDSGEKAMRP